MGVIFYKNKKYTGSGARLLSELLDVLISSPSNGQVIKYNNTTQKWENGNIESNINDSTTAAGTTWSSSKIDSEITSRVNASINTVLQTSF